MDKGTNILISFGFFLLIVSIAGIQFSSELNIGLTVFVSILTIHDYIKDRIFQIRVVEIANPTFKQRYLMATTRIINKTISITKLLNHVAIVFSIPLSYIYATYYSNKLNEIELEEFTQNLNVYTLGILILYIASEKLTKDYLKDTLENN